MRRVLAVGTLLLLFSLLMAGTSLRPGRSVDAQANPTLPPTNTPRGQMAASATPTTPPTDIPPTATFTATPLPTETATLVPSPTATEAVAYAGIPPTPTVYYPPNYTPQPQPTGIPTAMPRLLPRADDGSQYNVINIVLLGHDTESNPGTDNIFRTDTMIVVNVNLTTNTVSMLALPRDLLVSIPDWGMQRLNLAWGRGETYGWTDGGWGLFRQTVLYNFGIELHYYAMVDFSGFKTIIDELGGLTIAVDCPIRDYLWTGEYDENEQPIYELTTLPVGVHMLNSREALWYARSRTTSSDFDRGRRQQQILRAIWAQSRDAGFIAEMATNWDQMTSIVQTNMPLEVMLQLAPLGLQIQPNQIENHFFRLGWHTQSWTTPSGDNVHVPNPSQAMIDLIRSFLIPPTENQLVTDNARINIYDGSGQGTGMDYVAVDRLVWEGLLANPMGAAPEIYPETVIVDYTGSLKGSSLDELMKILNIDKQNYRLEPDPNSDVDFEIFLGQNYNSCIDREVQPVENLPPATPTPNP